MVETFRLGLGEHLRHAQVEGARLRACPGFPTACVVREIRPYAYAMGLQVPRKMRHTAECSMTQLTMLEAMFGSIILLLGIVHAVDP